MAVVHLCGVCDLVRLHCRLGSVSVRTHTHHIDAFQLCIRFLFQCFIDALFVSIAMHAEQGGFNSLPLLCALLMYVRTVAVAVCKARFLNSVRSYIFVRILIAV